MFNHPKSNKRRGKTKREKSFLLILGLLILSFVLTFARPAAAAPAYYFMNDMRYTLWITRPSKNYEKRIYDDVRISKSVNGIVVQGINPEPMLDPLFCILPFSNIDREINPLIHRTTLPQLLEMDFTPADMSSRAQRLQDIAYFNFLAYPPEQRNLDLYADTQIMIWECLGYTLIPYGEPTLPPTPSYPKNKALSEKRISDWANGASFQGTDIELAPGESVTLKDEGSFIELFMPLAGFSASTEQAVGQGLFLSWNGGDELTLRADEQFQEDRTLSFSSGETETAYGWYSDQYQSIMQPGKKPETRELCLHVRSVTRSGSLEIYKTAPVIASWRPESLENGQTLYHPEMRVQAQQGAVFALFDPADPTQELRRLTTDETGYARIEDIPLGRYLLREIDVPQGYRLVEDQQIELSLSQQSKTAELHLDIENQRAEFRVDFSKDFVSERTYSDDELCSHTIFGLRTKEELPAEEGSLPAGSLIALARPQGESQPVLSSNPVPGTPDNAEISPLRRFNLSVQLPFAVPCVLEELGVHPDFEKAEACDIDPADGEKNENGDLMISLEKPFLNRALKGKIRLIKKGVDSRGVLQTLPGAHFSLWREERCAAKGVTDEEGSCVLEVPDLGPWYLREEKSPDGYLPFEGEKEISLKSYTKCLELEIFNNREPEPAIELQADPAASAPPSQTEEQTEPSALPTPSQEETTPEPVPSQTETTTQPVQTDMIPEPTLLPTVPVVVAPETRPVTLLPGAFEPAKARNTPALFLPKTGMETSWLSGTLSLLLGAILKKRKR